MLNYSFLLTNCVDEVHLLNTPYAAPSPPVTHGCPCLSGPEEPEKGCSAAVRGSGHHGRFDSVPAA